MLKKLYRFFTAAPIISFPVILVCLIVSFVVVYILSIIIPMSLALWILTIISFPAVSIVIIAVIFTAGILLRYLYNTAVNKKKVIKR